MRGSTRVLAGITAVALAATVTACSSSGGSKKPKPQAKYTSLTGATTVALDSTFLTEASLLGVTPKPYGTAKVNQSDVVLPITGGNVTIYKPGDADPAVQGEIDQNGSGLSLAAGSNQVIVKNLVINLGATPTMTGEVDLNGKVFAKSVVLFDVDATTMKTPTVSSAGVATLQGATIYLSKDAADALNTEFNTSVLSGGKTVKIGTLTVEASGK